MQRIKLLALLLLLPILAWAQWSMPLLTQGSFGVTYGTISIRSGNGFGNTAMTYLNASALNFSFANTPTAGDIIVCMAGGTYPGATTITMSDTIGDTGGTAWGSAIVEQHNANIGESIQLFWRTIGTGASAKQVTATGATSYAKMELACGEYAKSSGSWHLDGTPTTASASQYPAAAPYPGTAAITVNSSSSLVIVATENSTTHTTASSNYTRRAHDASHFDYDVFDPATLFTAGSQTTTQVTTGSTVWTAIAISIDAY